jgi:hypothetical protein
MAFVRPALTRWTSNGTVIRRVAIRQPDAGGGKIQRMFRRSGRRFADKNMRQTKKAYFGPQERNAIASAPACRAPLRR